MPPISYWFTGSAIGALIALLVTMTSLGWAWYNAALNEQKLAHTSARSRDVRAHLQEFYVRGVRLRDRPLPKETSQADFAAYVAQVEAWVNEANSWIENSLGHAASAKFLDVGPGFSFSWNRAINEHHNNIINQMTRWVDNLSKMVETDVWDTKK